VTCLENVPAAAAPLVELARCVCEKVSAQGCGSLCWCGIYPGGLPAWDYCGECDGGSCGMAYVTVVAIEPYTTFGVGNPLAACASMLQAVVQIGVIRCLPVVEDGLPSEEDLADVSIGLVADALAIREAVLCCTPSDTVLRSYTALPAQGGCVGGQWEIVLDLGV